MKKSDGVVMGKQTKRRERGEREKKNLETLAVGLSARQGRGLTNAERGGRVRESESERESDTKRDTKRQSESDTERERERGRER